jgi:hypothetical protein
MAALLWFVLGWCAVTAEPQTPVVSVTLDTNIVNVPAGAEFTVALNATITPGWHINSDAPDDESLIPTRIGVEGTSITLVRVEYPKADVVKLAISENPLSVFEGKCEFTLTFKCGEKAKPGREKTTVILYFQACNDQTCLPPTNVRAALLVQIGRK